MLGITPDSMNEWFRISIVGPRDIAIRRGPGGDISAS
jgi:hypothetical protein